MEILKMDGGGRQSAEPAVRCPLAITPSALVLTSTQTQPTKVTASWQRSRGRRWQLAAESFLSSQTYWQVGAAFLPESERRDHPGPPIRELTTHFGPRTSIKRHENMEEGSGEGTYTHTHTLRRK